MDRELWKKIFRENKLNEAKDYAKVCIDYNYLSNWISDADLKKITKMYNDIANKTGDTGTCVLGNGIEINGKIAIRSYSQGSIGIEKIQQEIIPYLKKKYPKLKINYKWGHMD